LIANINESVESKVISAINETIPTYINNSYNGLKTKIGAITFQIKDLAANNHQLQEQVKSIITSMNDLHKQSYAAAVQPTPSTTRETSATLSSI